MNRLTQRSQLQRGFVIRDIARAYALKPSAIYTRKELQEKCKNIILHSGWLRELQHYGILQCQGNSRRTATYSFLPKSKAEFEIKSKRFVGLGLFVVLFVLPVMRVNRCHREVLLCFTIMKKLEIEIPNDKEIDWEASAKQKQIVFKDKQLTYEDVCEKLFDKEHYFTDANGTICRTGLPSACSNNAVTTHQLECILAKNMLANVARYLNGDWKPGKTDLGHFDAYVIYVTPNKDYIGYVKIQDCAHNSNVLFKSGELAKQAIKILGEDTIKLALEPLY